MYGLRTYTQHNHGYFNEVATLFVNLASFNAAAESFWNSSATRIPMTENHTLSLMGRVANASFPVHELMHGVVRNAWPDRIVLVLAEAAPPTIPNGIQLQGGAISNMVVRLVGTAFLRYYEKSSRRMKAASPGGPKSWPELWRFAWLLRNAIAHSDIWSINDPLFPVTNWRGIAVACEDSGLAWFDPKRFLGGGDVLLLLEELDDSLKQCADAQPVVQAECQR